MRNLRPARLTHKVRTPVGELRVGAWNYKPWVSASDPENVRALPETTCVSVFFTAFRISIFTACRISKTSFRVA